MTNFVLATTMQFSAKEKPNVLFIAVDDLNDWIACIGGHPQAKTSNKDKLAEGILFTNAIVRSQYTGLRVLYLWVKFNN